MFLVVIYGLNQIKMMFFDFFLIIIVWQPRLLVTSFIENGKSFVGESERNKCLVKVKISSLQEKEIFACSTFIL